MHAHPVSRTSKKHPPVQLLTNFEPGQLKADKKSGHEFSPRQPSQVSAGANWEPIIAYWVRTGTSSEATRARLESTGTCSEAIRTRLKICKCII
jgi:hypothetical protein